MMLLEQSTSPTVLIGPFVDDGDGNAVEDGLTIAQADVRLSKNAGNMAQKNEATTCTHDELGYYTCPLNTTDTGTLGRLKLMVHESGALPVWHDFMVVPSNVYDSLVLGIDNLDTNVASMGTAVVTATAIQANAIGSAEIADNAITNAKIASSAINSTAFAESAITSGAIATSAIGALEIADGAIDAATFAAGAIDASAMATDAITEISSGVWNDIQEGTLTAKQIIRILLAGLGGKSDGGGTTSITFRDYEDAKDRISATVDANGNRTAITLDGS